MLYQNQYRSESARMVGYDYSAEGYYFVTICTENRFKYFGAFCGGKFVISECGERVLRLWQSIPQYFNAISLDECIVMSDHFHGIIRIHGRDAINRVSTGDIIANHGGGVTGEFNPMLADRSLSKIVRWFKGRSTFEIRKIDPEFAWQTRFHDRIVRTDVELNRIRRYIHFNEAKHRRGKG